MLLSFVSLLKAWQTTLPMKCCAQQTRKEYKYILEVPTEPHRGEVSPAQLAYHMVSVDEQVADLHRMVATCKETSSEPVSENSAHETFSLGFNSWLCCVFKSKRSRPSDQHKSNPPPRTKNNQQGHAETGRAVQEECVITTRILVRSMGSTGLFHF